MVVFNYSGREVNAKIVYYGPALSGKTTNLELIYSKVPGNKRGKMISMKTKADRTLFFDFLPISAGQIEGFNVRFLLYTVPGQVYYNATRKLVLKGADAVVFVADSQSGQMENNRESLANLRANLAEYGVDLDRIPLVIQWNKRDLPNTLPVEELERELNPRGAPSHEAVATTGEGVFETVQLAWSLLSEQMRKELEAEKGESKEGEAEDETPTTAGKVRPSVSSQETPAPETAPSGSPIAEEAAAVCRDAVAPAAEVSPSVSGGGEQGVQSEDISQFLKQVSSDPRQESSAPGVGGPPATETGAAATGLQVEHGPGFGGAEEQPRFVPREGSPVKGVEAWRPGLEEHVVVAYAPPGQKQKQGEAPSSAMVSGAGSTQQQVMAGGVIAPNRVKVPVQLESGEVPKRVVLNLVVEIEVGES